MIIEVDGAFLNSEMDFYGIVSDGIGVDSDYCSNLDALWDLFTTDVERPFRIVFRNSTAARKKMPVFFDKLLALLRDVESQDRELGLAEGERFELIVE